MLRSPLSVHVSSFGVEKHIDVSDLEFTRVARGGYHSATFRIPQWVDSTDPALSSNARIMVDDGRNADRVWEGFLDIPGKDVQRSGHTWQIGAVGTQAVLGDQSKPYWAICTSLDAWEQGTRSKAEMTAEPGVQPDTETDAILAQLPRGVAVATNSMVAAKFRTPGGYIGGTSYRVINGVSNSGYRTVIRLSDGSGTNIEVLNSRNFNTGISGFLTDEYSVDFGISPAPYLPNRAELIAQRTGAATNVADDDYWAAFSEVRVSRLLTGQDGSSIYGAGTYTDPWVLAHQVVVDALRYFNLSSPTIDLENASIDTSFIHQIDQFYYPDGVRLTELFDDVALLEPDVIWEVLEGQPNGKHKFNLRRWDSTEVRYEADSIDGWNSPGGEMQLANSLTVYWTDNRGRQQTSTYGASVPELDQWNRVREADAIELGSEVGSQAAADRVGAALLEQITNVPYAGTLTVARPIRDLFTGRSAMPWEIEPGYLLNVRDIDAPPLRLNEMTYTDSDQSAKLTLGTPTYTPDELVNKLAKRRLRAKGLGRPPIVVT